MLSVQAAETQSKGSFQPSTTISTRFHNQNASTGSNKFAFKMCEKLRKRILASEILTRILITSHLFKTEKCKCTK